MVLSEDWSRCATKSTGEWTTTIPPSVLKLLQLQSSSVPENDV